MNRETFILVAIAIYLFTVIILVAVLNFINKIVRKKYKEQIDELEREKNLVISASIITELNKVEALATNDELKEKYDNWQKRFKEIKDVEMPKISDEINDIDEMFEDKNYKDLKGILLNTELDLNSLKTKADYLLGEIKEFT